MSIVNKHPDKMSPLGISLVANDGITTSGVAHRSLAENGHNDVLLKYMEDALQKHHISPDALQRHMDLITSSPTSKNTARSRKKQDGALLS